MRPYRLSFAQLVKVMALNKVELVRSPPAPVGYMYFVGLQKREAIFPFSTGPVHYLDRQYAADELIPVRLIHSWIKRLNIPRDQFWADATALSR